MIGKTQQNQAKTIKNTFYNALDNRSELLVYATIDIWFASARNIAQKLHSYYEEAIKMGQMDVAMVALERMWRQLLLGGEKLSLITISAECHLRPMVSGYFSFFSCLQALFSLILNITTILGKTLSICGAVCYIGLHT